MRNNCLTLVALACWACTILMTVQFVIAGIRAVLGLEVFQDSLFFTLMGMILLSWIVTGPRALVGIRRLKRRSRKAVATLILELNRAVGNRPPIFIFNPFKRPQTEP